MDTNDCLPVERFAELQRPLLGVLLARVHDVLGVQIHHLLKPDSVDIDHFFLCPRLGLHFNQRFLVGVAVQQPVIQRDVFVDDGSEMLAAVDVVGADRHPQRLVVGKILRPTDYRLRERGGGESELGGKQEPGAVRQVSLAARPPHQQVIRLLFVPVQQVVLDGPAGAAHSVHQLAPALAQCRCARVQLMEKSCYE